MASAESSSAAQHDEKIMAFAQRLVEAFVDRTESASFSPLNIMDAMRLLHECASPEGQRLIEEAFQAFGPDAVCEVVDGSWARALCDAKTGLERAALLFGQHLHVSPECQDALETMNATVMSEGDASRINGWVSKATHGHINEVVRGPLLDVYLLTAFFFKGTWENKFKKERTQRRPFRCADGCIQQVPMMNQLLRMKRYHVPGEVEAVLLPYTMPGMSAIFVKASDPKKVFDMGMIRKLLSAPPVKVDVTIPTLDIKYEREISTVLRDMGLSSIFEWPGIHLSKIQVAPDNHIKIERVQHQTKLKVDEEGTVAAAVTIISGRGWGRSRSRQERIHIFRADEPFYMLIMHEETLLFFTYVAKLSGM